MNAFSRQTKSWMAVGGAVAVAAIALLALFGTLPALGADAGSATHSAQEAAHASASHGTADHGHGTVSVFSLKQVAHSYLTAYMFCLSLCIGSLFLTLAHHLFDAGWSASIRRVTETVASLLFPWMLILVIPIIVFAWTGNLHAWFKINPADDHALDVKKVLFNPAAFTVMVPVLVTLLGLLARTIRSWSIAQDKDGAAHWTSKSRKLSAAGIFFFAVGTTLLCFLLMKSLQHQFFSTMYGVYFFAGSVWTTLITLYLLTMWLSQPGRPLEKVYFKRQQQDLAVLFFAFTVFYAYIHFSQYFLIWNAALPEETFWYVRREVGSWKWVGMIILFGHFFVPFLLLLNQDIKRNLSVMIPVGAWAWLMQYIDMTYNVMPVVHPDGLHLTLWDPIFWIGMSALMGRLFWSEYRKNPPYPLKDPRLQEAIVHHEVPAPGASVAH